MSSPKSTPMGPWTEQDTLRYIYDNYLLISDEYGKVVFKNGMFETTDEKRTGCMYCACGVHKEAKNEPNRFQRLKRKYPKLHEYCMKDWAEGGLGLGNVLDYMGIEYGDYIDTLENYEQLSLLDSQMELDTYQYPLDRKGSCKCFNFEDFYKPVRVDKIISNEETEEAKNNIIVAS
ncbi:MAG: hypothetical protein N3B21_17870 [Clostridia bacterium]|nr:hypothetical protein [Clostridia bacterium]